ncbi:MAG: DbpA RNA binding domain-containing protein [Spirochaetales bacterium]|uniref:DbpA RNA binding domain-containing protein n=1 Tax=Candidatus Thalassospirochaeta sargassi TaxID=3119039 RepID=A0AAJ1IDR3_9SPIO|nr:DbpA RNA binding domain-containing protein [Spirochaetales bacterium]
MHQKITTTQIDDEIHKLMKNAGFNNPTPLQNKVFPVFFQKKDIIAGVNGAKGKRTSYVVPILVNLGNRKNYTRNIVIVSQPENVRKAGREFSRFITKSSSNLTVSELISDTMIKQELKSLSNTPDIIIGTPSRIIDHIRRENIDLSRIETAVVDAPSNLEENGFNQDLIFIFSKMPERRQNLFYTDNLNSVSLIETMVKKPVILTMKEEHSQESSEMKKNDETVDLTLVENSIKDFIKNIVEEEDPDILNVYRKLFKKHTPFSRRGYLSAYLLKMAVTGGKAPRRTPRKRDSDPNKTTLFISVGKNRRVFPKDLARLFQSRLDLEPADIGAIKVLDSYSFMDISKEHAERAIELLDGEEFKGRKLTVNHARKRSGSPAN